MSSIISFVIVSHSLIVNEAISNLFNANLKSPPEYLASVIKASSSILILLFNPSSDIIALFNAQTISSIVNGFISTKWHLLLIALFIEWYGLLVVAPIKMIVPFSIWGSNISWMFLFNLWTSSII